MLGAKIDAQCLSWDKTKNNSWFKIPARLLCAGFLISTCGCVMSRGEGERLAYQVRDLENEMAKMQRVRHDMEILLSGQKKTIDRLGQLENQLSSLRESLVDGHSKSTELTAEIQNLRNEIEEAQYRYKVLEDEQKNLVKQKASKQEKNKAPENRDEHFALAKKLFNDGKTDEAISMFEQFIQSYPKDNDLAQANYFLAESYNKRASLDPASDDAFKYYKKAVIAYQEIVEKHAQSGLREEALFKLGQILKSMGNKEAAIAAFKELLLKHKGSKRAAEAKIQISELEKSR